MSDKFHNPEHFSGIWFCLHSLSKRAVDPNSEKIFEGEHIHIISDIKCENCRNHAIEDFKEHPMNKYFGIKDEKTGARIGCFIYEVDFHNRVNERLKKKKMSRDEAIMLFYGQGGVKSCVNCGKSHSKDEKKKYP